MSPWPRLNPARPADFEEQIYAAVLRPGDLAIDVGANKGDVALFMARRIGPGGKVVAFEPVWPVYETLCARAARDRSRRAPILTVPFGAAEKDRTSPVHVPEHGFGLASMAAEEPWRRVQRSATLSTYDCSFVRLDAFLKARGLGRPDFIKIDVEGAERFVLQGLAEMLSADARPLMLIEVFAPWEQAFGYSPWDVLSDLMAFGYEFLFACPRGLVEHRPSPEAPFPDAFVDGYNVVAFDPGRHAGRVASLGRLRAGAGGRVLKMASPPRENRV